NSAVRVLRGKRNFFSIRFPVRFKCLTDLPPFICEAISFSSPKNDESLVVNGRSLMTGPTTQAQILSSLLLECGCLLPSHKSRREKLCGCRQLVLLGYPVRFF